MTVPCQSPQGRRAMSAFQPVSRTRVADQVAGAIREAILNGDFPPGERLPAERELATQFDVNRSSVREALHRLEAWGLVDIRHGGGVTVADFLAASGLHVLPWLLAPNGEPDPELMRDLLGVRVAMLEYTASEAAAKADDGDVSELERALAQLEAASGARSIQEADFVFFEALVTASGNRVLQLMAVAVGTAYRENRDQFAALYPEVITTDLHRSTVEAIKRSDPAAAGQAMRLYAQAALAVFSE